jgi:hypothetical protein
MTSTNIKSMAKVGPQGQVKVTDKKRKEKRGGKIIRK